MELFTAMCYWQNNLNSRRSPHVWKCGKEHVVFQKGKRNQAVTIDPAIVKYYGLVVGLDCARFYIVNGEVIIRFSRRGTGL